MNKFFWLVILLLAGCEGFEKENVIGRYYLTTDVETYLSYETDDGNSVGVVGKSVFAVGYDANYIILKQHPPKSSVPRDTSIVNVDVKQIPPNYGEPDINITNYFIVPISKKYTYFPEKGIVGPLTLDQFNIQKKSLGIKAMFNDK